MLFPMKMFHCLGKIDSETVNLRNEARKEKWFGASIIFKWYGNYKNGHLSADLASKFGQPESIVNVNTL